jgi:hypothetical protein
VNYGQDKLLFHLRASSGVSVVDGTNVLFWEDQSGNRKHFTTASEADQQFPVLAEGAIMIKSSATLVATDLNLPNNIYLVLLQRIDGAVLKIEQRPLNGNPATLNFDVQAVEIVGYSSLPTTDELATLKKYFVELYPKKIIQ